MGFGHSSQPFCASAPLSLSYQPTRLGKKEVFVKTSMDVEAANSEIKSSLHVSFYLPYSHFKT